MLPSFFIIGAPKCGTTSVASWLHGHPQIFMPKIKELSYFDWDNPLVGVRKRKDYFRFFSGVTAEHKVVGEASPNYLCSKVAIDNILTFNPESKFIVLLRNPVEMAISLHAQLVFNFHEDEIDFERAWHLQSIRKSGRHIPAHCKLPNFLQYKEVCSLGNQLELLFLKVMKEKIFIILLDDLHHDTIGIYRKLLNFLDVGDDGRRNFPILNTRRMGRPSPLHRFLRDIGYLKQRLGFGHIQTSVGKRLDSFAVADSNCNLISTPKPAVIAMLEKEFSADTKLLEILTGRKFKNNLCSRRQSTTALAVGE